MVGTGARLSRAGSELVPFAFGDVQSGLRVGKLARRNTGHGPREQFGQQAFHIAHVISQVLERGADTVEPSLEAQRESLARLLARHEGWDPGYGFWAIVEKASGRIAGAVILKPLPGHPEIEVGWHLARRAWGNGYATEAGRAAIEYGFETLGLRRIVAVVNPANTRSLAVCRRLGMRHEGRTRAYDLELELFAIEREG